MTSDRWERIGRLFEQLRALPPEERQAFLERETGDDHALRAELEAMLASDEPDDGFLRTPITPGSELGDAGELTGRRLGDFEITKEIGRGGMGVVCLARQLSLDREVAIKLLPDSPALGPRAIERFRREARAAGRLSHPAITKVHSVGRDGNLHYFVMEYVPGHDLHQEILLLQQAAAGNAPGASHLLPAPESRPYLAAAAGVVEQIARALADAHTHGVVHRDIKPHNILLDRAGHPHLVDFGLARDESYGEITHSGDLAGTPHYMSPEQVQRGHAQVDHRTDIFSLGVVLYELITLRRPFRGKTSRDVFHRIALGQHPSARKLNPRVPRDLATICETALATQPSQRYATAEAMADDLARFLDHEAILARPPGALERLRRLVVVHRMTSIAAGVGLVAVLVGFRAGGVLSANRLEQQRVSLLNELLDAPDWSRPDVLSRLGDGRRVQRLLASGSGASDATQRTALRFALQLDELRRETIAAGPDILAASFVPWAPDGEGLLQAPSLQPEREVTRLMRVADLFPEDEQLRRLTSFEATLPRLDVSADQPDARVAARRIDISTSQPGEAIDLGPVPLHDATLLPGYYHIVVSAPGFRPAEFTRLLSAPLHTTSIEARLRPRTDAQAAGDDDMLLVRAGVWRTPEGERASNPDPLRPDGIAVEPFLIDRREVSLGEYRAFLNASGHVRPSVWPAESQWDPTWDELPAVGMSWENAREYAEWVGKRLPTHAEWEWAVRGNSGRRLPWGAGPPPPNLRPPVLESVAERLAGGHGARWADFVAATRPVNEVGTDLTPEGLLNTLGNVEEWTESLVLAAVPPGSHPHLYRDSRWHLGACYRDDPDSDLSRHARTEIGAGTQPLFVGIRCVRSVAP